jgi:hypothetical protein
MVWDVWGRGNDRPDLRAVGVASRARLFARLYGRIAHQRILAYAYPQYPCKITVLNESLCGINRHGNLNMPVGMIKIIRIVIGFEIREKKLFLAFPCISDDRQVS